MNINRRRFLLTSGIGIGAIFLAAKILYLPAVDSGASKYDLINIMRNDPEQQRKDLIIDSRLMTAAQNRSDNMTEYNYFNHFDPDGKSPNQYAREAGYILPEYYPDNKNNIESILSYAVHAEGAWKAFMGSPPHKKHLLGLVDFYANQIYVGVGLTIIKSGLENVVILTAPKEI